jgi:hypothetical protein
MMMIPHRGGQSEVEVHRHHASLKRPDRRLTLTLSAMMLSRPMRVGTSKVGSIG